MRILLITFLLYLTPVNQILTAQILFQPELSAGIESLIPTGNRLPLYAHSLKYGRIDPGSANLLGWVHFSQKERFNQFTLGGEVHIRTRFSENSSLYTELFNAFIRWKDLQFKAGRFYQTIGLSDDIDRSGLSIGSLHQSRNAQPMFKLQLSVPEYSKVPYTHGFFHYKGFLNHGWFEPDRYVKNVLQHQKAFYLRLKIGWWYGYGSIIHSTQWGGVHPVIGQLPKSFSDYIRVMFAQGAAPGSNTIPGEMSNVIGNNIAAYDFATEFDLKNVVIGASRLFYLEDGVSTRFRSPWDGMWTFNLTMKNKPSGFQATIYEFIYTKQQDAFASQRQGRASYYNHSIYRYGWTYEGRAIGNPLLLYNNQTNRFYNNIIIAHNTGMIYKPIPTWEARLNLTYTRNYGIQSDQGPNDKKENRIPLSELRKDEYYLSLYNNFTLSHWQKFNFTTQLTADIGEMGNNLYGFMIGMTYTMNK